MTEFLTQLSNRQLAIIIWIVFAIALMCLKSELRQSIGRFIKAFFQPKLIATFGSAILYVTGNVACLKLIGLWSFEQLASTIEWTLTFAFVAMFEVIGRSNDDRVFRKLVRDLFTFTVVFLFITEMHSFSLLVEILILPIVIVIAGVSAVAELKPEHKQLHGWLQNILIAAGSGAFLYSLIKTFTERETISVLGVALDFSLPILLSLLFLPFLFLLSRYIAYESAFTSFGHWLENTSLKKRAKWKAVRQFGWNIDFLNRWKQLVQRRRPTNEQELDETFSEIRKVREREMNPPKIAAEDGWSPYAALKFLQSSPLTMRDYHWCFEDEWMASSDTFQIGNALFKNRISYFIEGGEIAATSLKLRVRIDTIDDASEALDLFKSMSQVLLLHALQKSDIDEQLTALEKMETFSFRIEHWQLSLERNDLELSGPLEGAYNLTLQILVKKDGDTDLPPLSP
ncbi:hypothetical protein [Parasphingorhabdus halotolerans]|uniref:Uncharacterized protein n=1 Tax=Parasphingorhabdus halotolerans TaxID=2725558 RepID=A0A6H2DME0_9SPHN|nr:hypothetical protein [Parasphingorhabdus halotolerans]QJB68921.1 hypothetical protein HF685_06230 [Parasphingorhabdus halotolerans]